MDGEGVSLTLPSSKSAANPSVSHSYSKLSKKDGGIVYILPKPRTNQELEDLHTCSACQVIFTSVGEYLEHKETVHSGDVKDGEQTRIATAVVGPATEDMILPSVSCEADSQLASLASSSQQTSILYKCSDCQDLFPDVTNLQQHMMMVHRVSIMSDNTTQSGTQQTAEQTVSSPVTYSDRTTASTEVFHMEMISVKEEEQVKMDLVNADLETNAATMSLKKALGKSLSSERSAVISQEALKKVKCSFCGKFLKDISSYKAHLLTHSSHRGFVCTWEGCSFAFKTKGSLKRHIRRHTDERPFKCDMCLRTFRESGALTRHLKSRTPCTVKTDADLPKYKKSVALNKTGEQTALEKQVNAAELLEVGLKVLKVEQPPELENGMSEGDDTTPLECVLDKAKSPMVVKVVTVINTDTGKKIQLAVPTTTHIIRSSDTPKKRVTLNRSNPEESQESTSQPAKSTCNNQVQIEQITTQEGNLIIEVTPEATPLTEGAAEHQVMGSCDQGSELPSELSLVDHGVTEVRTAVFLNADLDEDPDMDEELIGETITLKDDSLETSMVHIGDVDLEEDEAEDDEGEGQADLTEEELVLSMEEVTCEGDSGEGDSGVQQGGGEGGSEGEMEIDAQQGVPLTNKRKCQACDECLADEQILKDHLKTHLIAAGYKCPNETCKYIAPKKDNLTLHLEVVHGHKDVELGEEEKETEQEDVDPVTANVALRQLLELQGNLDSQVLLQSNNQPVKVLHGCPVCQRKFTLNYLKVHIRAHTGEKPYHCPHCGKQFRTKDTLTKHLPTHSNVRKYECGECGKMFKRISHAREHLKVHSQDRQYCCNMCSKSFKSANGCKVHMRTHNSLLPWVCPFCSKSFREKGGLERHLRTHTGEKPYKCRLCGRGFAEHGTLSRHYKAKVPCTSSMRKIPGLTVVEKRSGDLERNLVNIVHCDQNIENDCMPDAVELQVVPTGEEVIQYSGTSEDLPEDAGHFVTLVSGPAGQVMTTNACVQDTVLEEFSTVVTDTQEYIVGRTGAKNVQ